MLNNFIANKTMCKMKSHAHVALMIKGKRDALGIRGGRGEREKGVNDFRLI